MVTIDRDALLSHLRRLGSDDDDAVLEAARAAAALVAGSGADWNAVVSTAMVAPPRPVAGAEPADEDAMIVALLSRQGISDDTRESLKEMAGDLAQGRLSDEDRNYVRGLYARLKSAG